MNVALSSCRISPFSRAGRPPHRRASSWRRALIICTAPLLDAETNGRSKKPIVEMLIPSTLDRRLAPKGKQSLRCSASIPLRGRDGRSWDKEREKAADTIIATVDAHAPGFAKYDIGRQIHSPLDLERRFGLIGGDIFHGKMGLDQLFSARPMIGAANYECLFPGLYLCGSGAHPGGGVTRAGHNAAQAVLADASPGAGEAVTATRGNPRPRAPPLPAGKQPTARGLLSPIGR